MASDNTGIGVTRSGNTRHFPSCTPHYPTSATCSSPFSQKSPQTLRLAPEPSQAWSVHPEFHDPQIHPTKNKDTVNIYGLDHLAELCHLRLAPLGNAPYVHRPRYSHHRTHPLLQDDAIIQKKFLYCVLNTNNLTHETS